MIISRVFLPSESIDRYRQILADGAIEIAELDVVAASPVIRAYVCGFVGVPDLSVGAVQIIVAHILNQAAAAFFSDELDVDGRVVTVDIAGVEVVETAVLEHDGRICGILDFYEFMGVVVNAAVDPLHVAVQHETDTVDAVWAWSMRTPPPSLFQVPFQSLLS